MTECIRLLIQKFFVGFAQIPRLALETREGSNSQPSRRGLATDTAISCGHLVRQLGLQYIRRRGYRSVVEGNTPKESTPSESQTAAEGRHLLRFKKILKLHAQICV